MGLIVMAPQSLEEAAPPPHPEVGGGMAPEGGLNQIKSPCERVFQAFRVLPLETKRREDRVCS